VQNCQKWAWGGGCTVMEEVIEVSDEVSDGSEGESDVSCNSVRAWPLTQHSQASQQLSQPSQPTTQSQSEQVVVSEGESEECELVEGEGEGDKEDNELVGSLSDDEEDDGEEEDEEEGGREDGRSVGASDMSVESEGWLCHTQQPLQRSDHETAETAGSPPPQAATTHPCVPNQPLSRTPTLDALPPPLSPSPCATATHSATVPCHTIQLNTLSLSVGLCVCVPSYVCDFCVTLLKF
jgi:hypothetical protein